MDFEKLIPYKFQRNWFFVQFNDVKFFEKVQSYHKSKAQSVKLFFDSIWGREKNYIRSEIFLVRYEN